MQDLAKGGHKRGSGGKAPSPSLRGPPEAKGVWGQSPMPPSNFRVFTKKNTHFGEVFLSKKDPSVPEILTTRIGIRNNARAKGGTMAPWPPLRAPIWSIHYF